MKVRVFVRRSRKWWGTQIPEQYTTHTDNHNTKDFIILLNKIHIHCKYTYPLLPDWCCHKIRGKDKRVTNNLNKHFTHFYKHLTQWFERRPKGSFHHLRYESDLWFIYFHSLALLPSICKISLSWQDLKECLSSWIISSLSFSQV